MRDTNSVLRIAYCVLHIGKDLTQYEVRSTTWKS